MRLRLLFFIHVFCGCHSALYDGDQYYEFTDETRADCIVQEDLATYTYLGDRSHNIKGESCLFWREIYDWLVRKLEKKPHELENFRLNMSKAEEAMLHNKCRRVELAPKHPMAAKTPVQGPWCYVVRKKKVDRENCFDVCKGDPREYKAIPEKTHYGEQLVEKNYNDILIENIRNYFTLYSWGNPSYYIWKPSDEAFSAEFFQTREKIFYGCATTVIVLILWLLLCLYIRKEAAASRRRREEAIKILFPRRKVLGNPVVRPHVS